MQFITLITAGVISLLAAALLFPILISWGLHSGYTDKPGHRKIHRHSVPVVGGMGIVLTVLLTAPVFSPSFGFVSDHITEMIALAIIAVTGIIDDKYNVSARKRLLIELVCAGVVAHAGVRIESLHGFVGIGMIPLQLQYFITIVLIAGITNAFNLLDGIDGLAGGIALINLVVLCTLSVVLHDYDQATLIVIVAASLLVFLKYNWRPASLFLGDCGSLFLGFLMSIIAIRLLNISSLNNVHAIPHRAIVVVMSAIFMMPVVDTLRVFLQRMRAGRSPFSADKTHLHHKLIQHFMLHSSASKKLLILQLILISISPVMLSCSSISVIILLQALTVLLYTAFLDFAQSFSRWFRLIRRMEANQSSHTNNF